MRTFEMTINNTQYKVIANNEQNIVDAFKLRVKTMEWQFDDYGLKGWRFEFNPNLPMRTLGMTIYDRKVIELNSNNFYIINWETLMYVMLHEIAHALTPNETELHGKIWQAKCIEIGIPAYAKLGMKEIKKVNGDIYQVILQDMKKSNLITKDNDYPDLPW